MTTTPSNLNQPTAGLKVANPDGTMHKLFWSWFAALATVASWAVTGALTAGSAVLSGLVELKGTLQLDTAVPTPANGQLGAGDAGWIVIGSGGNIPGTAIPVPGFQNNWKQTAKTIAGAAAETTQFRKLPSGLVVFHVYVDTGNNGQSIFTFPADYRPAAGIVFPAIDLTTSTLDIIQVLANGQVIPNGGSADGVGLTGSFYAEQ